MKKYLQLSLVFLWLSAGFCGVKVFGQNKQKTVERAAAKSAFHDYAFYLGTYTSGKSRGIYRFLLHKDGTLQRLGLAARTENPSYITLSPDKRFLLAVNENNPGTVESYAVFPDSLHRLTCRRSGGSAPCYVSVNRNGEVLTANYGSGTVGLLQMDKSGKLSKLLFVERHNAAGKIAHAHEARFLPGSRQVVSVDLGTGQLWFSRVDASGKTLVPDSPQTLDLPPGVGPRHFVLHPDGKWMYVVNELGNSISMVHKTAEGKWILKKTISTLPSGFKGKSYCAEIRITNDGRFLYVSNRGHNSLTVFRVSPSGDDLKPIDYVPVRGDFPRFFILSPDENYLLVANQKSENLVVFRRDKNSGLLHYVSEMKAPSPVCIAFDK
jgi:6-phosphogluconolactonase